MKGQKGPVNTDALREKYLPLLAQACFEKFCVKGDDHQNFKNHLLNLSYANPQDKPSPEAIEQIIKNGRLSGKSDEFEKLLAPLKFFDLMDVDSGRNLKVIDPKDLENFDKNLKSFFKVTFDEKDKPTITPLDQDQIWGENGIDKAQPFVVINPGNGPANKREQIKGSEQFEKGLLYEPKLFEKGAKDVKEPRQYLVALNEMSGAANFDLIKDHNARPDDFTTPRATEQARLIYGPLIAKDGVALPDQQIVENLSKARNFNTSFGTVTANCQINALVAMMRGLKIKEETIRDGVEGMRRFDCANVAKASENENGIFPSTVILEGSNDEFAAELIGGKVPALPKNHDQTNISVVPIVDGSNRIKVYQTLPIEIYNPAKKPTEEQKQDEDRIVQGLPKIYEERFRNSETKGVSDFAKIAAKALAQERKGGVLKEMGLDNLRFKDPGRHSPPHLTMPATPGNEVGGRDPELLYKLMADMMTRDDPRNVNNYFEHQVAKNTQYQALGRDGNVQQKISDAATISKIAVKTGLAPNQLIEMYQSPDVKKTDVKTMAKDLSEKGAEVMKEAQKKFAEDHKPLGKANGAEKDGEEKNAPPEHPSWVERVGGSHNQHSPDGHGR